MAFSTRIRALSCVFLLFGPGLWAAPASAQMEVPVDGRTSRSVAVTIDGLPVEGGVGLEEAQRITRKLLGHIQTHGVPAIGFVNERKLAVPGEKELRTALLRWWLDAGLELGNHTYSHPSLQTTPLEEFKADVVRGAAVTGRLLRERGDRIRYFRHPYLMTGPDVETKREFAAFLAKRGYRVAPVTIGHYDWLYATAYNEARGDSALMRRVGEAYLEYIERDVEFSERLSRQVLGYEIKQILLLHATALNAEYLDDVFAMLERRGYTFITLDQALEDEAYERGDTYTGPLALNWLERWAFAETGELVKIPPARPPVHPRHYRRDADEAAGTAAGEPVKSSEMDRQPPLCLS